MTSARDLAQAALNVLRVLDKLDPYEQSEVLHIATSIVQVEVARLIRPQPVKDE